MNYHEMFTEDTAAGKNKIEHHLKEAGFRKIKKWT